MLTVVQVLISAYPLAFSVVFFEITLMTAVEGVKYQLEHVDQLASESALRTREVLCALVRKGVAALLRAQRLGLRFLTQFVGLRVLHSLARRVKRLIVQLEG